MCDLILSVLLGEMEVFSRVFSQFWVLWKKFPTPVPHCWINSWHTEWMENIFLHLSFHAKVFNHRSPFVCSKNLYSNWHNGKNGTFVLTKGAPYPLHHLPRWKRFFIERYTSWESFSKEKSKLIQTVGSTFQK